MNDKNALHWIVAIITILIIFTIYATIIYIPKIKKAMMTDVETYEPPESKKVEWEAVRGEDKG